MFDDEFRGQKPWKVDKTFGLLGDLNIYLLIKKSRAQTLYTKLPSKNETSVITIIK